MKTELVSVNDSWVSIDTYGNRHDPSILMIPGVMSDARAWRRVATALRSWPTVVVLNRRGREPSGPLTDRYSLRSEVNDASVVSDLLPNLRTLFGWSYGGLIALHLANVRPVPHLIAYEPVMRPFGSHALGQLQRAQEEKNWDATVAIAAAEVGGLGSDAVDLLREDHRVWQELRRLSVPVYAETAAINDSPLLAELATKAERIDLVVGELNQGLAPYGISFDDVARTVERARTSTLAGQGHLAHLEAPSALAGLLDQLGGS